MNHSIQDIISDVRHSADVDWYTKEQREFLWSIAERLEAARESEGVCEHICVCGHRWWSRSADEPCPSCNPRPPSKGVCRENGCRRPRTKVSLSLANIQRATAQLQCGG